MISEKSTCTIINQLYQIQKKLEKIDNDTISRNLNRILDTFEEDDVRIIIPLGEDYSDTRTDCEASISGDSTKNLKITEVVKPIILKIENGFPTMVQKGVVIVEGK